MRIKITWNTHLRVQSCHCHWRNVWKPLFHRTIRLDSLFFFSPEFYFPLHFSAASTRVPSFTRLHAGIALYYRSPVEIHGHAVFQTPFPFTVPIKDVKYQQSRTYAALDMTRLESAATGVTSISGRLEVLSVTTNDTWFPINRTLPFAKYGIKWQIYSGLIQNHWLKRTPYSLNAWLTFSTEPRQNTRSRTPAQTPTRPDVHPLKNTCADVHPLQTNSHITPPHQWLHTR